MGMMGRREEKDGTGHEQNERRGSGNKGKTRHEVSQEKGEDISWVIM
jgi:hypothetical protein